MRLKTNDASGTGDLRLKLIGKWLGEQFPQVKGLAKLAIRRSTKFRMQGYCSGRAASVWVNWKSKEYPYRVLDHRYSSANCWKEDYEVNNVYELFVAIAGHELAHMQKAARMMRKSRRESFCNKRGMELVQMFRSEKVLDMVEREAHSICKDVTLKAEETLKAKLWAKSPDGMIVALEKKKKKWLTKLKRAQTSLRKIERGIKYYDKKRLDQPVASC